jgi:hypothetical protein
MLAAYVVELLTSWFSMSSADLKVMCFSTGAKDNMCFDKWLIYSVFCMASFLGSCLGPQISFWFQTWNTILLRVEHLFSCSAFRCSSTKLAGLGYYSRLAISLNPTLKNIETRNWKWIRVRPMYNFSIGLKSSFSCLWHLQMVIFTEVLQSYRHVKYTINFNIRQSTDPNLLIYMNCLPFLPSCDEAACPLNSGILLFACAHWKCMLLNSWTQSWCNV